MTSRRILGFRPDGVIAPFVSDDLYKGLRQEGHDVFVLDTVKIRAEHEQQGQEVWDTYIQQIRDFNPEFAIFYGTCGVILFSDRHSGSGHLLADLDVPIVPCFFDDPNFVLGVQSKFTLPPETLCGVWDQGHLQRMGERGFTNLFHLPLGTDPEVFKPLKNPASKFTHELAFTGSLQDTTSFVESIRQADDTLQIMFERAIRRRLEVMHVSFHEILETLSHRLDTENWERWGRFIQRPDFWNFHNALNQVTNAIWREQVVTSIGLNGLPVAVYGNEAWEGREVDFRGGIDYHKALPRLYASTPLHLNLTAPQLDASINNRIYDVLASGSAIITDWRESLAEAFDPEDHLIVFHTVEEGVEKALEW